MRFKVKYQNTKTGAIYWCTIEANDLTEADILAKRKARKDFIITLMTGEY